MTFNNFSIYLKRIEDTSSRNDITVIVSELISKLHLDESKHSMYLVMGRIAPKFVPLEFNFSSKLIIKALSLKYINVLEKYKEYGDLGTLVEELNTNTESQLDIHSVFELLKELANISGSGSVENKINKYLSLINQLDSISAKYVTRIIVGDLRLGMSDKTILDSISWYVCNDKSLRKILDSAYGKRADLGDILELIKQLDNLKDSSEYKDKVIKELENIKLKPGVPVASKLVEREVSSESVFKRMNDSYVQPKLDGLRGQLHYSINAFENLDTNVAVYSRNMELMTDQFPELTNSLKALGVDSVILDSEIIGVNQDSKGYATYQDTMKRRRKYEIDEYSKDIPVKAMCFDILYLNGKDLTDLAIDERLKLLEDILKNNSDSLEMLETKRINTLEELESYFRDKVGKGLEGIIVKDNNTNYEPGTRNFKWIKLKANTLTEMVDTIDVVVMGYYKGKGDRARFGFGTLLAGVYDPNTEMYYTIGKVGSGFSEELMNTMFKDLEKISVDNKPDNYIVSNSLIPDVWVNPLIIMEIIADEITKSPNHTAAINIPSKVKNDDSTKGLSIRFPRMKIWNRVDKDYPNTISEIVRMYELRKAKD